MLLLYHVFSGCVWSCFCLSCLFLSRPLLVLPFLTVSSMVRSFHTLSSFLLILHVMFCIFWHYDVMCSFILLHDVLCCRDMSRLLLSPHVTSPCLTGLW